MIKGYAGEKRKLTGKKSILAFFWITWVTYLFTYFGRVNFTACISDMNVNYGFSKSSLGIIAAALLLSYGIGQLVSGILGDRLSPVWLVFMGIEISACMNLLFAFQINTVTMTAIWFINGFAQSLIWSPIVRLCSVRLTRLQCTKTCVDLYTTGPAGMLAGYGICAVLVHFFSWRACFIAAFCIMTGIACLWVIGMRRLEYLADKYGMPANSPNVLKSPEIKKQNHFIPAILSSGLILIIAATLLYGMLKDGITTWVPTFLTDQFNVSAGFSIGLTTVLPVINLTGVYLAKYVNQRYLRNEMKTAGIFFGFTSLVVLSIVLTGRTSVFLTVFLFASATSAMIGVSTLLVGLIPLYFKSDGRVSTVTGLLNSAAHLGGAVGSILFGSIAEYIGWGGNYFSWLICACLGVTLCVIGIKRWKNFSCKQIETLET